MLTWTIYSLHISQAIKSEVVSSLYNKLFNLATENRMGKFCRPMNAWMWRSNRTLLRASNEMSDAVIQLSIKMYH